MYINIYRGKENVKDKGRVNEVNVKQDERIKREDRVDVSWPFTSAARSAPRRPLLYVYICM